MAYHAYLLCIMLLSSAQKVAPYAQYFAHNYCDYATVCINIKYTAIGFKLVVYILCCSPLYWPTMLIIMVLKKIVPHLNVQSGVIYAT